jgi:hypothetical protein
MEILSYAYFVYVSQTSFHSTLEGLQTLGWTIEENKMH